MTACPDEHTLLSYEDGRLDDAEAAAVERHLLTCDACRDRMEALRKGDLRARIVRAAVRPDAVSASLPAAAPPSDSSGPAAAEPDPQTWDIPDYERVRLCGEGAYGSVWVVRDRVGLYRALKIIDLRPVRQARAGCREMPALETYCRQVVPHPNLIQIFHVGLCGPLLYYVMELADHAGDRTPVRDRLPEDYHPLTLQYILRHNRVRPDAAINLTLLLLRGLAHLHAARLAHRDIKPANIIFVNHHPNLADIGMVTAGDEPLAHVGTPDYMPPDRRMDCTADTYAMGKVLHEMLCAGLECRCPDLPDLVLDGAADWDMGKVQRCLVRACSDRAEQRYATADRMIEDLESGRLLWLDSLLTEPAVPAIPIVSPCGRGGAVAAAAINALPWVLGLLLAMMLVKRLW